MSGTRDESRKRLRKLRVSTLKASKAEDSFPTKKGGKVKYTVASDLNYLEKTGKKKK